MTANLPDNVKATTTYSVAADSGSEITVTVDEYGEVWLRQDGDRIVLAASAVPGLIAALTAAANIPAPQDPEDVTDDGDLWRRNADGTFTLDGHIGCDCDPSHDHQSLSEIVRRYGIRSA